MPVRFDLGWYILGHVRRETGPLIPCTWGNPYWGLTPTSGEKSVSTAEMERIQNDYDFRTTHPPKHGAEITDFLNAHPVRTLPKDAPLSRWTPVFVVMQQYVQWRSDNPGRWERERLWPSLALRLFEQGPHKQEMTERGYVANFTFEAEPVVEGWDAPRPPSLWERLGDDL